MAIAFRSYCWVMGTTSFRTAQLNRKIEEQIRILQEFRQQPEYGTAVWDSCLQKKYYDFMKKKGFLKGDAKRPDKDAREKTSGLVELGLVDEGRNITDTGVKLLEIAQEGDFARDRTNLLELPRDSYLYLQQLLKASKAVGTNYVRPFVVLLNLMSKIVGDNIGRRFLSDDEFTYLLPLCVDATTTEMMASRINEAREKNKLVDFNAAILSVLMGMDNYQEAFTAFLSADKVTEKLMCLVGMNRKSGANGTSRYDAKYKPLYDALYNVTFKTNSEGELRKLLVAMEGLSGNVERLWKSFFFHVSNGRRITSPLLQKFNNPMRFASEAEFREDFFKIMHLLKAKATLGDYSDLNRRYFALSDCVVFRDGLVSLDALPAALSDYLAEWTMAAAYSKGYNLEFDISLEDIIGQPIPTKEILVEAATGMSRSEVDANGGVDTVLRSKRYKDFAAVLDSRFTKTKVSQLLELIENRDNDAIVQQMVTDDADIPTIFEYLVGIAWYYISERKGEVLEYMNLSLGPNFLPKTHAGGGNADIVWQYPDCPPAYSKHTLLIEVTVSEKDSQRRMEMEPVSRHLGDYMLSHEDDTGTYCTFVATHLNPNVISDFRGKRHQPYYDSKDVNRYIKGMKIIPVDTAAIRNMLSRNLHYSDLHAIFETNFVKETDPWTWYKNLCAEMCGSAHVGDC